MPEDSGRKSSPGFRTELYEIRVRGLLDPRWSEWLGCPDLIHATKGETILTCNIEDQTALHGVLARIRDLNLKLISVRRIEGNEDCYQEEDTHHEKLD